MCPLHGTDKNMNSWKVMLTQAKATKSTWSTACNGGTVRVRYQGTKKRLDQRKHLNALVSNAVKAVLITITRKKAKALSDSGSEDE